MHTGLRKKSRNKDKKRRNRGSKSINKINNILKTAFEISNWEKKRKTLTQWDV